MRELKAFIKSWTDCFERKYFYWLEMQGGRYGKVSAKLPNEYILSWEVAEQRMQDAEYRQLYFNLKKE